jgi:glycosyltransferase involved in cell wall biosynthesis
MNICLISREFPPFYGGGIGTYSSAWAGVLARAGHRVLVITVTHDGLERRERDPAGFEILRLPLVRGDDWSGPDPSIDTPEFRAAFRTFSPVSVFSMQIAQRLPALHEEFRFDIVEAPDTGALAWFYMNARRTGETPPDRSPPVVIHIHSPSAWIHRWNRTPAAGRRDLELLSMERDCARWADGLTAPSASIADVAASLWGIERDRIAVCPLPLGTLEPAARAASAATSPRPPAEPRSILYTGRLEPRKGVDTLITAAAIAGRHSEFTLTLVGQDMPDPDRPGTFGANEWSTLTPEARAHITLRPRVRPAELATLRAAADFVAVPSPHDNFPLTCVEAMAEGKPVIAANAGGMAEIIRDGVDGLLFAPGDPRACAEAIRRALALPAGAAAAMGRAAAQRILDLCANERVLVRRVDQFGSVAESPRAHATGAMPAIVADQPVPSTLPTLAEPLQRNAALDFACAWTSAAGEVRAISTPHSSTLAYSPPDAGPIAVSGRAAALLAARGLITPDDGAYRTHSTRDCLIALAAALSDHGAVVPRVLSETPPVAPTPQPPPARDTRETDALRRELDTIKSSRGWRTLQRVYRVLHILKGRGLPR